MYRNRQRPQRQTHRQKQKRRQKRRQRQRQTGFAVVLFIALKRVSPFVETLLMLYNIIMYNNYNVKRYSFQFQYHIQRLQLAVGLALAHWLQR